MNKAVNITTKKHRKTFEIMKGEGQTFRNKYEVGGRELDFKGKPLTYTNDEGLARDIEKKYGGLKGSDGDELRVMEVDNWRTDIDTDPKWQSGTKGTHNYTFITGRWKKDGKTMADRLKDDPNMEEVRPGVWKKKSR